MISFNFVLIPPLSSFSLVPIYLAATVAFNQSSYAVLEGAGELQICVTLLDVQLGLERDVTVDLEFVNTTSGINYTLYSARMSLENTHKFMGFSMEALILDVIL